MPNFLDEEKPTQETLSLDEIHNVINYLRGTMGKNDGDYRSTHLGVILEYLQHTKREDKRLTLAKLSLKVGMSQRNVKENYFDGLIGFGIIGLTANTSEWYWIGDKHIMKRRT